tara:strand:- start:126 stop:236 length:111 start_codon:yes stop_codon:yes gene_type:complete
MPKSFQLEVATGSVYATRKKHTRIEIDDLSTLFSLF